MDELAAFSLLSDVYPTQQSLYTEIINLRAILNLPRGTEHFISDIHGEYETFCHILNNCSGVIREKAERLFGTKISRDELNELLTLIYYPNEKLSRLHAEGKTTDAWYATTIGYLVRISRDLSSKYTRSKVRKAMPPDYAYVLDELLHAQPDEDDNQFVYHQKILETMISLGTGDEFIVAQCGLIKRLAVDKLHIIGDVYDRGPHAERIMDLLMKHHAVDFEWGNHDVLWMGAARGSEVCVAAAVRNCLQYDNLSILESGYGISLRPLVLFAQETYPMLPLRDALLHAVTVMMFKLEGELIARNPDFHMDGRRLLHRIAQGERTLRLEGEDWPVIEHPLPTVRPDAPYLLTENERRVMHTLTHCFLHSERLQAHSDFLNQRGRLFRVEDGSLLFHGCAPMTENGDFAAEMFDGRAYSGRTLMQYDEQMVRHAHEQGEKKAVDFLWYLWCAERSPVCGRRIRTFERYFLRNPKGWDEPMDAYYRYCETVSGCRKVLHEFGLDSPEAHIINGHTPIRTKDGESPLKAEGKLIVIDGGFCRPLQKRTGIAGYTLIVNSHGMRLSAHQPFTSIAAALDGNDDIHSDSNEFFRFRKRVMVADTDNGRNIQSRIEVLEQLLKAYRDGTIAVKEKRGR
ncbi:MAG: fructose-1,6-bisphosphatase [Eubacteriales bacterium]|nr:fructose-1,6-bisphosphatase [Eubacteriales bacterium]